MNEGVESVSKWNKADRVEGPKATCVGCKDGMLDASVGRGRVRCQAKEDSGVHANLDTRHIPRKGQQWRWSWCICSRTSRHTSNLIRRKLSGTHRRCITGKSNQ